MPKSDKPFPTPNKSDAPPGLLFTADLAERIPERARDLLDYEIAKRERERVLTAETKRLLSWHPWHTIRFLLLSGVVAFAITWFVSFLSALGRIFDTATGNGSVKTSFFESALMEIGKAVPTTTFTLFSKIPDYGAIESFFVALGVVLLIAAVKLIFILVHWKKIKLLGEAEDMLTEELDTLEWWRGELGEEEALLNGDVKSEKKKKVRG